MLATERTKVDGRSKRRRLLKERAMRAIVAEARETAEIVQRTPLALRAPEEKEAWVDLLHHDPRVTVDVELLRQAVRFAFESGDAGGLLGKAVDDAPTAHSSWDPEVFSSSLFLPELLSACFAIEIDKRRYEPSQKHLVRVLTHPTDDARDVAQRQHVLRELAAQPALRAALAQAYVSLRDLRSLLDERPMSAGETARRKIEVLTAIKAFLDASDEPLAGARSALSRLHTFAKRVRESDVYPRLAQLLEFDKDMARVEVRIVLGSDGKIRDFSMLSARENVENPLVWSPWRRFFSRFFAWFRGYRYGENEVLLKVIDQVFSDLEDTVLPCVGLIGDLELYLAALGFKDMAEKRGLAVCLPQIEPTPDAGEPPGPLELEALFNPLLILQDVVPTPCDLRAPGHDSLVLITGPNSGGKTRLLQALALTQLLAQNGVFVPAKSARLTCAPTMFVSLVEGAPADQKEGRLGTELVRVRQLFEQLEPGTFVVLDELCSGTNPSEGIAIFEMVLSLLPRLHPQVFVTTHFLDAARKLEDEGTTERLVFLQVELDPREKPTYQFVPGVAPTSLAHQVASRLGVTREELEALVLKRESELFGDDEESTGERASVPARQTRRARN
jgi:DNA mismatch repair protein MutS2